jgi:transposase
LPFPAPRHRVRKGLRKEAVALKEVVAELTLENRLLKKSMIGDGGDEE